MGYFITGFIFFVIAGLTAFKKPGAAIILQFASFGAFVFLYLVNENSSLIPRMWRIKPDDELVIFFLVNSIILLVIINPLIIFLTRREHNSRWPAVVAKMLFTLVFFTGLLIILLLIFQPLGILMWVFFVYVFCAVWSMRGYNRPMMVISTIYGTVQQNLPLATAMEMASKADRGKNASIFKSLSYWLSEGAGLAESLRKSYPGIKPYIPAAIEAGEKSNQLREALSKIVDDEKNLHKQKVVTAVMPWVYPVVVMLMAMATAIGISVFIIPTFAEIFQDISGGSLSLPWSTEILLGFSRFLIADGGSVLLLLLFFVVLTVIGFVYSSYRKRNPERPYFLSKAGDILKWYFPLSHYFERNKSVKRLLECLRLTVRAGGPIVAGIKNAANQDVNYIYKRKLEKWASQIEKGENISESARSIGLDRCVVWAFNGKVNPEVNERIFKMLESAMESNYSYALNLVRLASVPLMVLTLGLIVGFVVHSIFIPMVEITKYLTETALP
jgi:type IV pilus assembly protein PilC